MARTEKRPPRPEWFDLARYAKASEMDVCDWYLNLSLRCRVHHNPGDHRLAAAVQAHPLIRRAEDLPGAFFGVQLDPNFTSILSGCGVPSSVRALRCLDLYGYERLLPAAIKNFGWSGGEGESLAGYSGPVDHQFARPLTHSLVLLDLSMPDVVLKRDLATYIEGKRAEFAAIGEPQPPRDALDVIEPRHDPKLKVWAARNVLPLMDLLHWRSASKLACEYSVLERWLNVGGRSQFRAALKDADDLLRPFALDAWLLPLARDHLVVP